MFGIFWCKTRRRPPGARSRRPRRRARAGFCRKDTAHPRSSAWRRRCAATPAAPPRSCRPGRARWPACGAPARCRDARQLGAERLGRGAEVSLAHVDIPERGIGLRRHRSRARPPGVTTATAASKSPLRGMDLTEDHIQLRHVGMLGEHAGEDLARPPPPGRCGRARARKHIAARGRPGSFGSARRRSAAVE